MGGDVQDWTADLVIEGSYDALPFGTPSFPVVRTIPVQGQTISGPRVPGQMVQGIPTELLTLIGQISGDPEFALLRVTAGTSFGLPSPGHTTITQLAGGEWEVDSFFDITYRVDFVGDPAGNFSGMSGSTTSTTHLQEGAAAEPSCLAPDIGGTAAMLPACSAYASAPDALVALSGVPPDSPILGQMFIGNILSSEAAGGSLGGDIQAFSADMRFFLHGVGILGGYSRVLNVPVTGISHSAQRVPGQPVQSFPTDLRQLQGMITGDPDFDLFRIVAGTDFVMPSPGHTTLTRQGPNWAVDSFFDITYRVDFIGKAGGPLAGMSGSQLGVVRFQIGPDQVVAVGPADRGTSSVSSAYPNPTRGGAELRLRLAQPTSVHAGIFDVAGRHVRTIADGFMGAGDHPLRWDGRDAVGLRAAPGLYFYRVRSGIENAVRKVVLSE
jgi:hypothetical protein